MQLSPKKYDGPFTDAWAAKEPTANSLLTQYRASVGRPRIIGCAWVHRFCLFAIMLAITSPSVSATPLVSRELAVRVGLERAWFAQVRVDSSQHKVVHWLHDHGEIFALTSAGTIQAIDAETGATLWASEVGRGHSPAAGIAVNKEIIAVLGAGRIYVMRRDDGQHVWSRQVGGASSAAPALSEDYAYVVLLNGRVEGYRLDDPTADVWQYQSQGRTFQSPTTTGKVVSWPSDSGLLYVGQAERPKVLFRVETNDEIVAAPAEQAPFLYVGSLDGYLYCFHELNGSELWRYSTGFAITSQPAIVGEKAFVASEGPSLHAVNARTGEALWRVHGLDQFVALGKQHTYGMDRYGTLVVLDNETGGVAGRLATGAENFGLVNDKSDRIFLTNDAGLIQCFHEIGATEPTWHRAADQTDAESTAADESAESTKPPEESDESSAAIDESPLPVEADDDPLDDFDTDSPFE